jgi:hypothetical protein
MTLSSIGMEGSHLSPKESRRSHLLSLVSRLPRNAAAQPDTLALGAEHHLIRPSLESAASRQAIAHQAAAAGDLDIAALALLRAANNYRESRQPLFETFALVELAATYHLQKRRELLPALASRARKVEGHEMLTAAQSAIVRLAVELIESAPDDPVGLEMFAECWPLEVDGGKES